MQTDPRPLIHFHTDCDFFAGCEFMLANILNDQDFNARFEHRLSFRSSQKYVQGLKKRAPSARTIPLSLPDPGASARVAASAKSSSSFNLAGLITLILEVPMAIIDGIILFRLLKRDKPALLHINNGGFPGSLSCRVAAAAGRLAGVPARFMVVNNLAIGYESLARRTQWAFDKVVAKSVSLFITGSVAASQKLEEVLNVPDVKRCVINNGVIVPKLENGAATVPGKHKVTFGVVANHETRKGHLVLLEAISILRDKNGIPPHSITFHLEGSGPETSKIVAEIDRRKLKDFVMLAGDVEDIYRFMAKLDVLILPSISNEDFPNVISEAMGLGIPVIGSRVGGIPEQIDDRKTGLLVSAKDAMELARAIEYAFEHPQWRVEAGRRAQVKYEQSYKVDVAVRKYIALYERFINGGAL